MLTFLFLAWPKVEGGRHQDQGQEREYEVEESSSTLVVLKLLSAHRWAVC